MCKQYVSTRMGVFGYGSVVLAPTTPSRQDDPLSAGHDHWLLRSKKARSAHRIADACYTWAGGSRVRNHCRSLGGRPVQGDRRCRSQLVAMVAGGRNHLYLRSHEGRPMRPTDVPEIAKQIKVIGASGGRLYALFRVAA